MKKLFTILLFAITIVSFSQNEKKFKLNKTAKKDSLLDMDKFIANAQIKELHEGGAIVIRLLLHKKSADLYREAGDVKTADQIEKKLRKRNLSIVQAFTDSFFTFCPVYVIETKDYGKVINNEKSGYFLDENLKVDSSITLKHENIYFLEYGNVYETVSMPDNARKSELTDTPIEFGVMYLTDKNKQQLIRPFPYFMGFHTLMLDALWFSQAIEGSEFLGDIHRTDSVVIGDTVISLNPYKNIDTMQKGRLKDYLVYRHKINEYIIDNMNLYGDKEAFLEYIKNTHNVNKKDANVFIKVREWQTMMYGFYSIALSRKKSFNDSQKFYNKKYNHNYIYNFNHHYWYRYSIPNY